MADPRSLAGRIVATTRERRGELDVRLESLGATVVHVPLVGVAEPLDGGRALDAALASIEQYDWVVVTSPNGAERVAAALRGARCRVGVVGTRTAVVVAERSGRAPDLVPARQTAADLIAAMPAPFDGDRLLLPQADRADPAHAAGFAERGYRVDAVVAYRTVLVRPDAGHREALLTADAVAFASGSAAEAWADAIGPETPPVVATIGPATAAVATRRGIKVTAVATDHSIEGLTAVIVDALGARP